MSEWWSQMLADPWWRWVVPVVSIVIGVGLGWVVERLLMARLRVWAARRGKSFDHLLIDGLRGLPILWCALLGLWLATSVVALTPDTLTVIRQVELTVLGLSLTVAAVRIAGGLVGRVTSQTSILSNLTRVAVAAVGLLVVLQSLGLSVTPLLTALGVGGLAVALALQDPLSNLFAGLQLLSTKKLRVGDQIRLENGDEGEIADISWRYTTITTGLSTVVMIPNSKLASAMVTSYSLPDLEVGLSLAFTVAYGSDLEAVEQLALTVAREVLADTAGGASDFTPLLRFTAFGDSGIAAAIIIRGRTFADLGPLRHALIKRLDARFRAAGIALALPQRVVHLERTAGIPA